MKVTHFSLILSGALLAALGGLVVGLPLLADQPQEKAAPADADTSSQTLDKMIAELKAVSELIKQLNDPKFETRQQAADALIRIGKPAVEPLNKVLDAKPNLEMATRIGTILSSIRQKHSATFGKAAELREKLNKPIDLEKGFGAGATLADAIEFLSNQADITFIVDENAFNAISVPKPLETAVSLPKMSGVKLGVVLRLLVGQVKGDNAGGSYHIRNDFIEITTSIDVERLLSTGQAPRMHVDFKEVPLADALRELADSTGITIIVDKRVARKAQEAVTANLNDVGLDTAVRLLADMAGLKAAVIDNVLYVTSPDNARELEAEHQKRRQQRMEEPEPKNPLQN